MRSIKLKLVVLISGLILLILGLAAYLLIKQKEVELNKDLFETTVSFSELTAEDVVNFYNLYLRENSFVYFNREIKKVFQKNPNVDYIWVVNYEGKILYNSQTETDQQYSGDFRTIDEVDLIHVQAQNPSVKLLSGRSVFLKRKDDGGLLFVDENENLVDSITATDRVSFVVQPVDSAYVVVYGVSYDLLDQRVGEMKNNILFLAAFAVLIGLALAWFVAIGITRPILKVAQGAQKIALGDFKTRILLKTKDETQVLATTFNQMAQTLEITTKAIVYEERVKKELELAAKIQRDILPKKIPTVVGLDISAGLIPAEEIGGDCYDFIALKNGKWAFYLGDVTGHGVPSGIVVSITNAMFFASSDREDPRDLLVHVNRVLKEKTTPNMFLTLVLLQWDENTQTMKYVSAGHEPILVYRAGLKTVEVCNPGGIALGMVADISTQIEVHEIALEKGDFIVLYSDGIPEAWRSEKEMYGMARLKYLVSQAGDLQSATAIRNAIFADVKQFTGQHKQMDDITAMVIKKL